LNAIRDERGFFFGKTPHEILYNQELSSNAKVVYSALDDHAKADQTSFPGMEYLAGNLGLSLGTVHRAVKELVEIKAVFVTKKKTKKGWYNIYILRDLKRVISKGVKGGFSTGGKGGFPRVERKYTQESFKYT
jgi:hypothetical protein